jgi:predicted O-methyltransferase YrrM
MPLTRLNNLFGTALARVLPRGAARSFISEVGHRNPNDVHEAFGPLLNRAVDLDHVPFDFDPSGGMEFHHLAGLFSSTPFDHAVVGMPVRQSAYLFGFVRQSRPAKVIEIGRHKGGSTMLIAAGMQGRGEFWSIDIGEKEARLRRDGMRSYDAQIEELCRRAGLTVTLLVGDSRTIEVDTGRVDIVFIDGDHSYEGVKIDFERFGRRVRVGGAVLFDDAAADRGFVTHTDTVGRLVEEIVAAGKFKLVRTVNRLAHIERVAED